MFIGKCKMYFIDEMFAHLESFCENAKQLFFINKDLSMTDEMKHCDDNYCFI